jgi:ATP-dependent helicase HepA
MTNIAARIVPMPHQIFVSHRVVNAPRQRFLLADEVGLGKTIETGLILQELRARGALERVLVIVPPTLTVQWLFELRSKFNEEFKLYDSARVKELKSQHPGENIWDIGRDVIVSSRYLTSHEKDDWEEILAVPWDLVVIDEAHHVRRQRNQGDRQTATGLYRFAAKISRRTRGLLFLTATPMQLDPYELYSMVELLDPTLFYSDEAFYEQIGRGRELNAVIKKLAEIESLDTEERASLPWEVAAFIDPDDGVMTQVERILESQIARDIVMERLAEQHLLSEVMIRNRKRLVGQFKRRIPCIIPVHLSEAEGRLHEASYRYIRQAYQQLDADKRGFVGFMLAGYQKRLTSSLYAFRRSLERRIAKLEAQDVKQMRVSLEALAELDPDTVISSLESVDIAADEQARLAEMDALRSLLNLANDIHQDAKYLAFERQVKAILDADPTERILVFSQFVDTIEFLAEQLSKHWPVARFHGKMKPSEKDHAVARFHDGDARILLSSEAGGEGRNLQYCSILVNYDLPWNPMKVEQRIGRLDRIGQTRDIQIFNFALRGTIEERVLDVLHRRINAFEETVGGLDPILGEMEVELQQIILEASAEEAEARLHRYADELEARVARARRADEVQRDFIMDQRSYDSHLVDLFDTGERNRLERHTNKFSKSLLKYIGAELRSIGSDTYRVKLNHDLTVELPNTKSTYQVTFNYQCAIDDPVAEYGSFSHPLFDSLVQLATSENFSEGRTACRTIESDQHAGFRGFQFNFLTTLHGIRDTRRVVPIAIDLGGQHHPELVDLLIDSYDWQNAQQECELVTRDDWPSLVDDALAAAETMIERQLHQEVQRLRSQAAADYATERRRIERYCDYREGEGRRKLVHAEEIVERLRASTNDEERRVLPIWTRNVTNARQALEDLRKERERLLRELDGRQHISFSSELINAAWVTIVPVMPSTPDSAEEILE